MKLFSAFSCWILLVHSPEVVFAAHKRHSPRGSRRIQEDNSAAVYGTYNELLTQAYQNSNTNAAPLEEPVAAATDNKAKKDASPPGPSGTEGATTAGTGAGGPGAGGPGAGGPGAGGPGAGGPGAAGAAGSGPKPNSHHSTKPKPASKKPGTTAGTTTFPSSPFVPQYEICRDCHTHQTQCCLHDPIWLAFVDPFFINPVPSVGPNVSPCRTQSYTSFDLGAFYCPIISDVTIPASIGNAVGSCTASSSQPPPSPYSAATYFSQQYCSIQLNTGYGQLNLQGSLPGYDRCLYYVDSIHYSYADLYTSVLDGYCCDYMTITGGSKDYGLSQGYARVCLVPGSDNSNVFLVDLNVGLCGCEAPECCNPGPKYWLPPIN